MLSKNDESCTARQKVFKCSSDIINKSFKMAWKKYVISQKYDFYDKKYKL